jgi:hypothetical protein
MGLVAGYHLSLESVQVTFLVGPHHAKTLSRPQMLYCYDDNQCKTFKDYTYITDPAAIVGTEYEYILITLDAASLISETGQDLVKTIGKAASGSKMGVILGSIFLDLMPWFLSTSSLKAEKVTNKSTRPSV